AFSTHKVSNPPPTKTQTMPTIEDVLVIVRDDTPPDQQRELACLKQTCSLAETNVEYQKILDEFFSGPPIDTWNVVRLPSDLVEEIKALPHQAPSVAFALDRIEFLLWLMSLRDGNMTAHFPGDLGKRSRAAKRAAARREKRSRKTTSSPLHSSKCHA